VHTVFGRTADMDVVNAIRKGDKILSVKIEA
jgi:peptidyl-prolyl cis-trans isomerase B (cyclophilin B)